MKDFTQYCAKCDQLKVSRDNQVILCRCDHADIQRSINRGDFKNLTFDFLKLPEKELPTLILEDFEELLKNE